MKYFGLRKNGFIEKEVPASWDLIADPRGHLDEECNCAACGKRVVVRYTIMSKKYQPDDAVRYGQEPGYALCQECGMKEAKGEDENV